MINVTQFSLTQDIQGRQTKNKKHGKRGGAGLGEPLSLQVPFRTLRSSVDGLLKLHPSQGQNGD